MNAVSEVDAAPKGSYEAHAHELGKPFLFTDLKNRPKGSWLRGEFKTHVFISPMEGRVCDVFDAFFFVDKMKPVQMVK